MEEQRVRARVEVWGEICVAVDSNLGAVVETWKRENRPSVGECQRRYAVFVQNFWHSEGWAPRNEALMEAVVKQARTSGHPWLVACDANMDPEDFKTSLWYKDSCMYFEAPEQGSATCRSNCSNGELSERMHDDVLASQSLENKTSQSGYFSGGHCAS